MKRCHPVLLLLMSVLSGCTSQYIYSTNPVDARGVPLPLERATGLIFEDGARLYLNPGETIELADGRFTSVHGTWNTSQVDAVLWTDSQGRPEKSDVLTPDDLVGLKDPPRITRVQLQDGESLLLDDLGAEAGFAENGLTLEVTGPGIVRSLPLEDIKTLQLHKGDLLGSTIGSWQFWVVTGAAAVVAVIITRQTDDESIAVR